jgi:hypothetical protein
VKTLQKIIEMLHQDNGNPKIPNREDTADECVNVNEDFDASCITGDHGNGNASLMTAALSFGPPVYDSKFKLIAKVNPHSKCSDVVAYKKMCDYQAVNQGKSAALYSIPIIINGQVIPADKPTTEQKTKRPVINFSVTNDQCKDHKVLLLSDNQGRGCAEKIKNQLPPNSNVWGMVKPGASSNILNKSPLTETNKLQKKSAASAHAMVLAYAPIPII